VRTARNCFVAAALCAFLFALSIPVVIPFLRDVGVKADTPPGDLLNLLPHLLRIAPLPAAALLLPLLAAVALLAGVFLLLLRPNRPQSGA